ncbi:hypothetical protein MTO96_031806 [Rhipicephalus appendiculatus]
MDDVKGQVLHSWLQARRADIRRRVLDQENILPHVFQVNAYYVPWSNKVIVPASAVQPTLFFPHGPSSVNYGGLGATIGHEITHGFEANGFSVDDEGRNIFWGNNATQERFLEKALCLRKYHNEVSSLGLVVDIFHYRPVEATKSYPDDVMDAENMADFAGVLVALDAFNSLPLDERNVVFPHSAGVSLSPERAFFVSYCASNCDNGVKTDPRYAIGKGRCMVPVMNDPRFARAFGCSDTARMNPKDKCTYW